MILNLLLFVIIFAISGIIALIGGLFIIFSLLNLINKKQGGLK